jgi:hypothetical protein
MQRLETEQGKRKGKGGQKQSERCLMLVDGTQCHIDNLLLCVDPILSVVPPPDEQRLVGLFDPPRLVRR